MQGLELLVSVAGALILSVVVWDVFETIILPRSAGRGLRLTRFFFAGTWLVWRFIATRFQYTNPLRHSLLGIYGPLALILLITVWANLLVLSFAMLLYGIGSPLEAVIVKGRTFDDYLYQSGVTLFTLGYGDVAPVVNETKILCVIESGVGFGLLALVIGYLPTLYQTFARRETMVLRLFTRTGRPTSAHKLVQRYAEAEAWASLETLLMDWERWGAELLESHRSYPVLAFYRSQSEQDSWLATAVIFCDVYDVIEALCPQGTPGRGGLLLQADATRNIVRDSLSDLSEVLRLQQGDKSAAQTLSRHLLLALPPTAGTDTPGE